MWSLTGLLNNLAKKERSLKLQRKRNARKYIVGKVTTNKIYSWEGNRQQNIYLGR